MKRVCLSSPATRMFRFAWFFAFFLLSGCDLFDDGETCQTTTKESKVWTPRDGITSYRIDNDRDYAFWRPILVSETKLYTFENVCPHALFKLNIKVKEKSNVMENQAYQYLVKVKYSCGEKFLTVMKPFYLYRIGETTWESNTEMLPDPLSLVQSASTFYIDMEVGVPETGSEYQERALEWAKNNIESISIEGSFTRYR